MHDKFVADAVGRENTFTQQANQLLMQKQNAEAIASQIQRERSLSVQQNEQNKQML